jgi:hypothetical protein
MTNLNETFALTDAELDLVAGGLNPQPLPPARPRRRSAARSTASSGTSGSSTSLNSSATSHARSMDRIGYCGGE